MIRSLLLLLFVFVCSPDAVANTKSADRPPSSANEVIAMPWGGWLALDKSALKLISSNGNELAKIAVRGKHLDARVVGKGNNDNAEVLAILLDSDASQPLVVRVRPREMVGVEGLAPILFTIETLCMFRDAQGVNQVFVLGKDGITEQWLLGPGKPLLFARHALPANTKNCVADDASRILYASEPGVGIWAYDVSREGNIQRALVVQYSPRGALQADVSELAVTRDGLAALVKNTLYLFQAPTTAGRVDIGKQWRLRKVSAVGANERIERTALNERPSSTALWLRADSPRAWKQIDLRQLLQRPQPALANAGLVIVEAVAQTDPVGRFGDAADDPAIWIHPTDPTLSRVLGTNKKQGLLVYDLDGKELQFLAVGRVNNVDVRQNVKVGDRRADLAVATQRDQNAVVLFSINANGTVAEEARLKTEFKDIYGICAGLTRDGELDVFVNDKDGRFLQLRATQSGNVWRGEIVRRFAVASQPEACVVDESSERIFIGEEKKGVWALSSRADQPANMQMVLPVGPSLSADVEGLALYQNGTKSYLVVSSQGNDSYVVTDAQPPYRVRGGFRIGNNLSKQIDGVSETDGLEVTSKSLGAFFPKGLLVVQDGYKRLPHGPQNFKYVSWQVIAEALKLP
jgi:3-phytase